MKICGFESDFRMVCIQAFVLKKKSRKILLDSINWWTIWMIEYQKSSLKTLLTLSAPNKAHIYVILNFFILILFWFWGFIRGLSDSVLFNVILNFIIIATMCIIWLSCLSKRKTVLRSSLNATQICVGGA